MKNLEVYGRALDKQKWVRKSNEMRLNERPVDRLKIKVSVPIESIGGRLSKRYGHRVVPRT